MKPLAILLALTVAASAQTAPRLPNIIVMFTDDQGYGDVGCYGATSYQTPNLHRLAAEGVRFTDFYVYSPVCSASRAALLTGCYHERVGISGALGPGSPIGLHPDEVTLAEVCRQKGYATKAIGKWHLGRPESLLPTSQGFQEYFGLPYSNDMWPHHPTGGDKYPPLPLIENTTVIDAEVTPEDQRQLTTRYTEQALDFIDRNKAAPFFLYLAHSMPHVPLYVSDKFQGKSGGGTYGDVIAEIDWSMGQILARLAQHGLDNDTLIVFTCDNGPWLSYGTHAGSAGLLREGKGTCWEGGIRVPFLARFPGRIPAGKVCAEPAMTIDVLPTVAKLIGAELPERKLDGLDIWPLLTSEPGAKSPHDALFFYYQDTQLQAMRSGKWKLQLPHGYRSFEGLTGKSDGNPVPYAQLRTELALYDLSADIGEKTDLAARHPEVVAELMKKVDAMRADLGDSLTKAAGPNRRPPGRVAPAAVQ